MIDGIVTPAIRDIDYLAPSAPYPMIPSGLTIGQDSIYRYSIPTDEQPVLAIIDPIPDFNGNFLKSGYYELALSDDREFLYLIESRELIAVIPVFKLAENEEELKKYRDKATLTKSDKKNLRREERKKKSKERYQKVIDTKYAKTSATQPKKDYVHMEADIEYVNEGGYYLIRYEKGYIRAWGAIKAVQ